jgi:hypothetical protein
MFISPKNERGNGNFLKKLPALFKNSAPKMPAQPAFEAFPVRIARSIRQMTAK